MAGGAGHVRDMTSRLKQNRALLTSKRERYAKYDGRYAKHDRADKLYSKTISHPELRNIKKHIQARAKSENRENLVFVVLITTVLVLIAFWIFT